MKRTDPKTLLSVNILPNYPDIRCRAINIERKRWPNTIISLHLKGELVVMHNNEHSAQIPTLCNKDFKGTDCVGHNNV